MHRTMTMLRLPLLLALLLPVGLAAQEPEDPYLWLEEVEGARAMEWVTAHNQSTAAELEAHPAYRPVYERTLRILQSDDRLAYPEMRGEQVYNFWQDERHPRGIWRRTSLDAYLGGSPSWETVIDLDSLSAAENVTWAWGGASCLEPEHRRCLVHLSRGGSDADQVREFDTAEKRFVQGGFFLPEAKQTVQWRDADAVVVATDFGPGTLTTSGYARTARLWRRGTPLAEAALLFEASATDMGLRIATLGTAERAIPVVLHRPTIFERAVHMVRGDRLVKLDLPLDATTVLVGRQLAVHLRSPWEAGGRRFDPGTIVAMPLDSFLAGERAFLPVVHAGERSTIGGMTATRDYLVVETLTNVRGQLARYWLQDGIWVSEPYPTPGVGSIGVVDASAHDNRIFATFAGFTQPSTLYFVGENGQMREVARTPEQFDASNLAVDQHEAVSKDGTRIPYFVVRRRDIALDGENPTVMYGYGGFEVPVTPFYHAPIGAGWLERGGVFVVANIRGGGEFGPAWHRTARRENRQRAYDDFIAVAEDLVARRITSPRRLGVWGGSNGGLLVGVAVTQRPDLFNAGVSDAPLLDMRRYSRMLAGASWMAEYGDPDKPEEWAYIRRYSPYHNLRAGQRYPRVLFTATTRDDRVHPGHARKMVARMEEMGIPVYYFENTEGGHGAGVTPEQQARVLALTFAYLTQRLMD